MNYSDARVARLAEAAIFVSDMARGDEFLTRLNDRIERSFPLTL